MKLTYEGKTLAEMKIQRGISLNRLLGNCTAGYKLLTRKKSLQPNIHDDVKLLAKNENVLETRIQTIRIYNQDIAMEFDIEKCAMLIMRSEKR